MEQNSRFILEPIAVDWDQPPQTTKTPKCPDRFTWGDETLAVVELLEEWRDFRRRGRMASNMRPEHAARARQTGSSLSLLSTGKPTSRKVVNSK